MPLPLPPRNARESRGRNGETGCLLLIQSVSFSCFPTSVLITFGKKGISERRAMKVFLMRKKDKGFVIEGQQGKLWEHGIKSYRGGCPTLLGLMFPIPDPKGI